MSDPDQAADDGQEDSSSEKSGKLTWKEAFKQPVVWVMTLALTLVSTTVTGVAGIVLAPEALVDHLRGGPAVTVIAILERDQQTQGEMWAFPHPLSPTAEGTRRLSAAGTSTRQLDEFRNWARDHGGADVGHTRLKLIVQSRRLHREVRITGLRAHAECGEPLRGTLLYAPTQVGIDTSEIGLDLDANDAIARTVKEDVPEVGAPGYLGQPFFDSQSIQVTEDQAEVLHIVAFTKRQHCAWTLELQLLADGNLQPPYRVGVGGAGTDPIHTTAPVLNGPEAWDIDFSAYQTLYNYDFEQEGFLQQDPQTFQG